MQKKKGVKKEVLWKMVDVIYVTNIKCVTSHQTVCNCNGGWGNNSPNLFLTCVTLLKYVTMRSYLFTLNNYSDGHILALQTDLSAMTDYLVYGKEVGESGTPHLQGYCKLKKQTRINKIHKFWDETVGKRANIEKARGNAAQNRVYCTKDGDFWESGNIPKPGKRNDIEAFVNRVKDGATDRDLIDEHPNEFVKYHKAGNKIRKIIEKERKHEELVEEYNDCHLRRWQTIVIRKLKEQDDRKVTWVFDPVGNLGKSWLAGYLEAMEGAFVVTNGKTVDIAYAYNNEPIVVFDYSRCQEERVNYNIIECFKNGRIFSSKYESEVKRFTPPAVLCLSNFNPNQNELSEDRWQLLEKMDEIE